MAVIKYIHTCSTFAARTFKINHSSNRFSCSTWLLLVITSNKTVTLLYEAAINLNAMFRKTDDLLLDNMPVAQHERQG